MIIHLNGWPGVGKRTIGGHLANRLGARLIDNHLLHDVGIVCAGLANPARWQLYEQVRSAAYAALSQHPADDIFVMTNGLCDESSREIAAWQHVVELAILRGVPLVPVVLEAAGDEIECRVESPDRKGTKLSDATILRQMIAGATLQRPAVDELIMLEVTALSAERAAEEIADRISEMRPRLTPATRRHLQFHPGGLR